jgi:radical SAM protein with 4Fe4S-binding SPASM domain
VLTGGEPLLRKDIEICGREIRKRGLKWGMVTNGHLYDQKKHISLLNSGIGALTISLDGLKESHNWLRNKSNSFGKVENAISLAVTSSRLYFDVVTCVNKRNVNELFKIHDYLLQLGVKAWRLFTITPIGRARNNQELFLSDLQLKDLMEFIKEMRKSSPIDIKFSCEGFVGRYELKVRDSYFFCRAGINIGSILIDGSISACPNIDRNFAQGNIYKDNFSDVWETNYTLFRDRNWTHTGKCKGCSDYVDCQGNGLHYWHGKSENVSFCHNELLKSQV